MPASAHPDLGTWCFQTKKQGIAGSEAPRHIVDGELDSKDLVQGKRKIKALRESLHQVQGVGAPKMAKDLVQRKRRNKVLRGFVHQVRGVGAPKRAKDLVQRKRRNKVLRESLHQVRSRGAAHHRNPTPEILHSVLPPTRNPSFSQ